MAAVLAAPEPKTRKRGSGSSATSRSRDPLVDIRLYWTGSYELLVV